MNIKKITIFLATFLLSLNVLAFSNPENQKMGPYNQTPLLNKVAFNQENLQNTLAVNDVVNNHTMTSSSIEVREVDFFTKFCIYLIIIMVYWIYWLKSTMT